MGRLKAAAPGNMSTPSTHRIRPFNADEMRELHMLQIRIINVLSRNGNLYHGITSMVESENIFIFLLWKDLSAHLMTSDVRGFPPVVRGKSRPSKKELRDVLFTTSM